VLGPERELRIGAGWNVRGEAVLDVLNLSGFRIVVARVSWGVLVHCSEPFRIGAK
jgi:hypothetical protein